MQDDVKVDKTGTENWKQVHRSVYLSHDAWRIFEENSTTCQSADRSQNPAPLVVGDHRHRGDCRFPLEKQRQGSLVER